MSLASLNIQMGTKRGNQYLSCLYHIHNMGDCVKSEEVNLCSVAFCEEQLDQFIIFSSTLRDILDN